MARILGRHAGPWALGLLGLVVLAPMAVFAPFAGALALAAFGAVSALVSSRRVADLGLRCDKLSGEVDVLSRRLLRLEAGEGRQALAPPEGAPAPATAMLFESVEEVTAEIGLLSGIVRELAAVVSAQDGDIAELKAAPRAPAAVVPSDIVVPPRRRPADEVAPVPRAPLPWTPRPLAATAIPDPTGRDEPAGPDQDVRLREAAMIAAFDGTGLEVHLQPLVSLPQRKVASYEALARLRIDGETLMPSAFLPVLERHGRTTDLDRRMLQKVSTIGRHLGGRGSQAAVAYALSPLSLFEPGFLRWLARLVDEEPSLAGRLVVALPQASWRSLDAEQAGALAALRGRIGFALDRPIDLRLDAVALAERGVGQVKVPVDILLRPGSRQALPDIALEDLVAALARAGIRLVADRVERESDVPDLIDLDVPLAQGGVFAPARAVRAEVLATAPTPAPEPPPGEEPEPPPQRRPFRDFLRRTG